MEIPVHIERSKHGSTYRVFCPDLPGCSATDATVEGALDVLRRRIGDYFGSTASAPVPPGVRRTVIVV
jgi:predicted RNase H-like HicB family nuclease